MTWTGSTGQHLNPNVHIPYILACSNSHKEMGVKNHMVKRDSEYFRRKKAIQSLRHLTKISLWKLHDTLTAAWLISWLRYSTGRQSAFEAVGQMEFFSLKAKRDKGSVNNPFQTGRCWSVVSCYSAGSSLRAKQVDLTNILLWHSARPDYQPLSALLRTLLPHAILPTFWSFCMKHRSYNLHCGCQGHPGAPKHTVQAPI